MSKIQLLVKTDLNINEMKRKEIQSINWSSFPFSEQWKYVNADVYAKLTKAGRRAINGYITTYSDKDIEFWNKVFEYNHYNVVYKLIVNSESSELKKIIENHTDFVLPIVKNIFGTNIKRLIDCGIFDLSEFLEEKGSEFTFGLNTQSFVNPKISVQDYLKPINVNGTSQSALSFMVQQNSDNMEVDDYPILLPSNILKDVGITNIKPLSIKFLRNNDACSGGSLYAKKWIKSIGTDGELEWDVAVEHIRSNPELFDNYDLINNLCWWWYHTVSSTIDD